MESCSNQKGLNKFKYILDFSLFEVATLCLDDSFAHSWRSLNQLHEEWTWNAFPTVLKEFPHMLSTCWLLFLHSTVQLIPNYLKWVEVYSLVIVILLLLFNYSIFFYFLLLFNKYMFFTSVYFSKYFINIYFS